MARSSSQKLKIIYLMDYLNHYTDEEHPVSVADMISYLEKNEIKAERKSIYDDLESLRNYGMDIVQIRQGKATLYYVGERDFEIPELKLMVDSVQSSKFITHKKTMSLIKKIENLASVYQGKLLNRQVFVKNRVKTMNESIYYNVDEIHTGIAENKKIRFQYFEYTIAKERKFRHDGICYIASPFGLTWEDENYYLVAYDDREKIMKHFRVDKMANIETISESRDGLDVYQSMDMAVYTKRVFGMFAGEAEQVQMRFENRLAGAVLDRLGMDMILIPDGEEHFTVRTEVVVSPQFFGWICGFGSMAQICAPESVVKRMSEYIRDIQQLYQ